MKSKSLVSLTLALLSYSTITDATGVLIGGNEWRQLPETTGFSWNQVATVCNQTTGACSGALGSVSFDGWTWADNGAIRSLFEQLIDPLNPANFPTNTSDYYSLNDPYVAAAFGLFTPTGADATLRYFWGMGRSLAPAGGCSGSVCAYEPIFVDMLSLSGQDWVRLSNRNPVEGSSSNMGVWLFRSVPEPGTIALFGLGLAGLGLSRRRKAH